MPTKRMRTIGGWDFSETDGAPSIGTCFCVPLVTKPTSSMYLECSTIGDISRLQLPLTVSMPNPMLQPDSCAHWRSTYRSPAGQARSLDLMGRTSELLESGGSAKHHRGGDRGPGGEVHYYPPKPVEVMTAEGPDLAGAIDATVRRAQGDVIVLVDAFFVPQRRTGWMNLCCHLQMTALLPWLGR